MDIRDVVKATLNANYDAGADALGEAVEQDLEDLGVIVAAEQAADTIRRLSSQGLTTGELADALAEEIESDLDEEEE